jgi:hypothetical protein
MLKQMGVPPDVASAVKLSPQRQYDYVVQRIDIADTQSS